MHSIPAIPGIRTNRRCSSVVETWRAAIKMEAMVFVLAIDIKPLRASSVITFLAII